MSSSSYGATSTQAARPSAQTQAGAGTGSHTHKSSGHGGKDESTPLVWSPEPRTPSFEISDEAKRLLLFVAFEFLVYVTLTIIILLEGHAANDVRLEYNSVLVILSAVMTVYFAVDGVRKENVYEHFCFLLSSLFLAFYVIFTYFTYEDHSVAYTIRLAAVAVFTPITLVFGYRIYNEFGWRVYKTLGADVRYHDMFRDYQIYFALLKITCGLATLLVCMSGLFLFKLQDWELYADIVALVIMFGWAGLGWQGVQEEQSSLLYLFVAVWPVYIVYIVWKIQEFFFSPSLYPNVWKPPFIVFGCVAVVIHLLLLYRCVRCWRNFGKGLKERVFARENPQHSTQGSLNA